LINLQKNAQIITKLSPATIYAPVNDMLSNYVRYEDLKQRKNIRFLSSCDLSSIQPDLLILPENIKIKKSSHYQEFLSVNGEIVYLKR
jgi:hypothetical protein